MDQPDTTRTDRLEHGAIAPLLLRFAAPATIGTIVNGTYNVVDRIFVGRAVGEIGLAATTVSFPIMLLMIAFGMMFGYGANAIISIRLGQKRRDQAEEALAHGVVLLVLLSIVFMGFGLLFREPLLRFFGASDTVLPVAKRYLTIILFGALFQEISFGVNTFIRGEGNPTWAMVTMIIGSVINVALDWLFLFVLGMGIEGAALATFCAQFVSALWVIRYYVSGRATLRLRAQHCVLRRQLVMRIMAYGSPPFFVNLAGCLTQACLNFQLRRYGGDVAIAVMGVVFSVLMLTIMLLMGLAQGLQPIVGYNEGARQYQRVRHALTLAIGISSAVCLVSYLILQLYPEVIFSIFGGDQEFITLGSHAVRRITIMHPFIGFMFITSHYFQATGRPGLSLLLAGLRQTLLLIPLILILPYWFGLDGVWYSVPLSDAGTLVTTTVLFLFELRRLRREGDRPDPRRAAA